MKVNVGKLDKILRIIVGVLLVTWGVLTASLWGAIGLIFIVTGLMSRCPVYTVAGVKTVRTNH
ncbi:MAG: DUF2892 domain-containing protein [Oceanospirillaceae bacterium]|nr:DUF2892 domain-containing protein [Oceanospirillaceae bacterium]